jgi:SAM-dependent methyltransferase
MDQLLQRFYPESAFGGFSDVDGTVAFYLRVNSLITPEAVVLDFGCGRGEYYEDPVPTRRGLRIMRGKVRKVLGIDVDAAGAQNPHLDEFRSFDGTTQWPVETGSIDLILCDNVLEHIGEPSQFFSEARRALRNGGLLCIRTPNALSYVGVISRLVPNRYHKSVLSRAQPHRKEEDIFPTVYRCNTLWKLRRVLSRYGFAGIVYGYEAEPDYLGFSKIAYALGVLHQRLAPRLLGSALFVFAQVSK